MSGTSIWRDTESIHKRNSLPGDISADTVIIGGGMAGILTAYFLKHKGRECIVLEEEQIGGGQTQNTTAKITSQHNLIYDNMIRQIGLDKARQYAGANEVAIKKYEEIIRRHKIDCEWVNCSAYLYTDCDTHLLEMECRAAERLGIPAELTKNTELPFQVESALRFDGQARFHPLKFLQAAAGEVTVYEDTKVIKLNGNTLVTNKGNVGAKNIVSACHYPFINIPGYYFIRMHQERSYVLAVDGVKPVEGMYLGIDPGALSVRSTKDALLIGGGGHRTGENWTGGQYKYLSYMADKYWPGFREVARWSAQDCMTLDSIPYIGRFTRRYPNWYVATGFGKWGMTSSMVSAMLLSDLICEEKNPYEEVFSPRRMNVRASAGNFLKEGGHAVAGLVRPKEVPAGQESGDMHGGRRRCPHMGCYLTWNPDEQSYDCPCHGSRFDAAGTKLDGPAQNDIQVRKEKD